MVEFTGQDLKASAAPNTSRHTTQEIPVRIRFDIVGDLVSTRPIMGPAVVIDFAPQPLDPENNI
jgi:hypothetical protein